MSRTRLLAAAAALLLAPAIRAQEPRKEAAPLDPKVEALVKEAVEKAKQELRDEVRVELQGAQSAAEFMGTVSEGPKLEFLELDGYLRARSQLFDSFDLGVGTDANGQPIFLQPINDPENRSTMASANMRARLEPTLNVSEHLRVRLQVDLLDDYVLGGTPPPSSAYLFTPSGPLLGGARLADRPVVDVKRAWGEVETPVGLLSFGRMPVAFGLGLRTSVGDGIDDDVGHTADRLQFATLPVSTPLGPLAFVPYLDYRSEGTLSTAQRSTAGQPFDLESGDDARAFGIRVVRLDTDEEMRRKHERNEASVNYGALYEYQTWSSFFPAALQGGSAAAATDPAQAVQRREYENVLDLWFRYRTARFHLEAEVAGQAGQIGNPTNDPAYAGPQVLVRTLGGVVKASYQVTPNKVTLGGELGVASGDDAPGLGNRPEQRGADGTSLPTYGALEGPQYGQPGDRTIRNFRFNPGYRVDLVLWREILGQVTDAWYLKPWVRWDIVSGLSLDAAVVYSQAMEAASTPSATSATSGSPSLGLELDTQLTYASDDGLVAWFSYGLLQPLDGLTAGASGSRAHALRLGVAIRF